jgi:hypothetical protein
MGFIFKMNELLCSVTSEAGTVVPPYSPVIRSVVTQTRVPLYTTVPRPTAVTRNSG